MADQLKPMDQEHPLAVAALTGDVDFLEKVVGDCKANNDFSYFRSRMSSNNQGEDQGNIFHLAARYGHVEFFSRAMNSLPTKVVQLLLSHQTHLYCGNVNPLHIVAVMGHIRILRILQQYYRCLDVDSLLANKAWRAQASQGKSLLHFAIENDKVECALLLIAMSADLGALSQIIDDDGNSRLFLAVQKGYTEVALEILKPPFPYHCSASGKDGSTALHFAVKSTKEVCQLLLEMFPYMLKARDHEARTVMHTWIEISDKGSVWPFEYLLKSNDITPEWRRDILKLIIATDYRDENPLHYTARQGEAGITRLLVEAYEEERAKEAASGCTLEGPVPWLKPNDKGETPLDVAIENNDEEVALCFLSPEIDSVLQGQEDNLLFLAIERKLYKVAERILAIQNEHGWSKGLVSGRERNVLHDVSHYKEEVAKWLVKKLPCFISKQDQDGKTPLHEASEVGASWLIELMLNTHPSSLSEVSVSKAPLPWVEACKRGHLTTVLAFIDNCPYFRDHCLEHHDTPLHHIRLGGYAAYKEFLKIPIARELKYTQDSDGATPLHRAIMNENIGLAEALLTTHGLDCRIKDHSDRTAMDLLATKSTQNQKWDDLCKRVGINPLLKMTYVQHETNLLDIRSTLSVVAALLATITFTAGFTLPGGYNNDDGEAILAKKAAFLVFIMSDTYAMCCSMLVLFCLIWSMICDHNKSLLLINRSLVILLQSLYGTLVAFMTGVATVIFRKSLWAAILIFVMCSVIAISVTVRIILFKLLEKLVTSADEHGLPNRLLQLGRNACTRRGASSPRSPTDPLSNV